ncbi:aminotransferase class V-fold PLP-dependent enzyme [Antarcticirhabdus aurantiaca]|uniref:Aminotransferase class V-fold PLP-dependent enzyme n=1 Tax=Antarcticirhabdus aurantiaca TaxID=2606717 RepID=A0ACD4NRZ4_9HYPH|nr:aminotransferase class V-fold PLP-dependent enzyme [Antarcticirhabdus aurantiaca]WAJ29411.1 aminotransferase class V-fold PLP-dependent enzyme [Jeongeuplla avenae]
MTSIALAAVRAQFPAASRMTYLDSGFQAPLAAPVRAAIESLLDEASEAAGPKSVWLERVETVRAKLARFINARAGEIAFTKNTSEALNIAANALPLKAGDNVLMIHGDHPNNAYAFLNLRRKGVEVRFLPMTEIVNGESFAGAIDARTRAISMSHVTFHAGHRFDVEDVGRLCRSRGLFFVVDVMQSVGVMPVDVQAMNATFVASGTHKGLLVPQGLGFLYWNGEDARCEPAHLAAASLAELPADLVARPERLVVAPDARRFEIGNFNIPAIHALGAALDLIQDVGRERIEAHLFALSEELIAGLDALGIGIAGPRDRRHRAAHIVVPRLPAATWLPCFERARVRVSPERDGIRVSLALFNTSEDVRTFIQVVRNGMKDGVPTMHAA